MPENQNTEYKQSWHDDYLKWVCGFANAEGGAIGGPIGGPISGPINSLRDRKPGDLQLIHNNFKPPGGSEF